MADLTVAADFSEDVFSDGTEQPGGDELVAVREFSTTLRANFRFPTTGFDVLSNPSSILLRISVRLTFVLGSDTWDIKSYGPNAQNNPEADAGATAYLRSASGTTYATTTEFRTTGTKEIDITSVDSLAHLKACIAAQVPFTIAIKSTDEVWGSGPDRNLFLSGSDVAGSEPEIDVVYTVEQPPASSSSSPIPERWGWR